MRTPVDAEGRAAAYLGTYFAVPAKGKKGKAKGEVVEWPEAEMVGPPRGTV